MLSREIAAKFKHMSVDEGLCLDRFQQLRILDGFWRYDVRLNVPVKQKGQFESQEGFNAWFALKQKRIDALVENDDGFFIIEVKKDLNFAQLGQLLVYREMFKRQYQPLKPIYLIALAAKEDPDIKRVMTQHNITIYIQ